MKVFQCGYTLNPGNSFRDFLNKAFMVVLVILVNRNDY